jgi:hypothetical protein
VNWCQKKLNELISNLKIERRHASSIWWQHQDNRGVKSTIKIAEREWDLHKGFPDIINQSNNINQQAIAGAIVAWSGHAQCG